MQTLDEIWNEQTAKERAITQRLKENMDRFNELTSQFSMRETERQLKQARAYHD